MKNIFIFYFLFISTKKVFFGKKKGVVIENRTIDLTIVRLRGQKRLLPTPALYSLE